jgi:hypothetical protein
MITIYPPFTIHQAEFALYLSDDDWNPGNASIYLGGCLEDMSPETEFIPHRLDRHGDPFGRTVHVDERHKFTVKNLWAVERGTNVLPHPSRNQQYAFVIVWFNEENNTWAKRIYLGVTADGQKLPTEAEVVKHQVPFTAAFMDEDSGLGAKPDFSAVLTGKLRYVTGNENTLLYRYDFGTNTYSGVDATLLPGRAAIVTDATQFRIDFNGVTALKVTSAQLQVVELSAIGGTFLLGTVYPRLEWWRGPKRMASLSAAGELAVPDIEEVDTDPMVANGFKMLVNAAWGATIGPQRASAKEFAEVIF